MKKILSIASVVMFITVFLGVGVICAQETNKKLTKKVEDEHAKIAQRHKEFMQRMNVGKQDRGPENILPVMSSAGNASNINNAGSNAVIRRTVTITVTGILKKVGDASIYMERATDLVENANGRVICLINDTQGVLPPHMRGSYVTISSTESKPAVEDRQIAVFSSIASFRYASDLDHDGDVDQSDRDMLMASYGKQNWDADVSGDGLVNATDLSILNSDFGKSVVMHSNEREDSPAFKALDTNGDLYISGDEAVKGLQAFGKTYRKSAGEDGYNDLYDFDGSGKIAGGDFGILSSLVSNVGPDAFASVKAFKALDTNGDLHISGDEAVSGLQAFGKTYRTSTGQDGYNPLYDFDGNGKIAGGDFGYLSGLIGNLDPDAVAAVAAFKAQDTNGDLQIDGKDLRAPLIEYKDSKIVSLTIFTYSGNPAQKYTFVGGDLAERTDYEIQKGDKKDPYAPLIEFKDGKIASLTIFTANGKPAQKYTFDEGWIIERVDYNEGDSKDPHAPFIEYKDGKIVSLTIFGSDGKPADKYTFDENGRIIENVHYGSPTIFGNDVNGDGKIDESDIEAVRSYTGGVVGNPLYNENADLNHDGRITGTDVVLLRNFVNKYKDLHAPLVEYKDGKIASLTIFGSDGKPADKYIFAEVGEKLVIDYTQHYGEGTSDEIVKEKAQIPVPTTVVTMPKDSNPDAGITLSTKQPIIYDSDGRENYKEQRFPHPRPVEYTKPEGLPEKVIDYNPDGTIKEAERIETDMLYSLPVEEKSGKEAHWQLFDNDGLVAGGPQLEALVEHNDGENMKPGPAGYPHPTPPDLNRIIGNDDQKPGPSGNVRYDNGAEFSEMKDVENRVGAQMQSNVQISRTMADDTQGQGEMLPLQKPE